MPQNTIFTGTFQQGFLENLLFFGEVMLSKYTKIIINNIDTIVIKMSYAKI